MRKLLTLALTATLAACAVAPQAPEQAMPITPPDAPAGAPVVRQPLHEPLGAVPPGDSAHGALPGSATASTAVQVPPGLLYVCATEVAGERREVGIRFAPKVHELCRSHPEMGPCQYEREVCRRSGGRVYAANGQEITLQTEAEYDRKVMRVRFRAN